MVNDASNLVSEPEPAKLFVREWGIHVVATDYLTQTTFTTPNLD